MLLPSPQHALNISLLISAMSLGGLVQANQPAAAAAQVTFSIGKASIIRSNGSTENLETGDSINAGDSIKTYGNGYVHLRFVDDAHLSIRPQSHLVIEQYLYDQVSPDHSRVRFKLEEGVSRSISGNASKGNPEKFRLSTPVAAIGVRGTDFTVSSEGEQTLASVHEGSITVQALSECALTSGCSADMMVLSDNDRQILQVMEGQQTAFIQPNQQPFFIAANLMPEKTEADAVEKSHLTTSVADTNPLIASTVFENRDVLAAALPDPNARQLTWGVWSNTSQPPAEFILNYSAISPDKHIAIGNTTQALFRNADSHARLNAGLGQADFKLDRGHATLSDAGKNYPLKFEAAGLSINFGTREFSTRLDLSHSALDPVTFSAQGSISSTGFFNSRTDDARISGALSIDGKEAGYLFSTDRLQGSTLWSQQ